MGTRRIQSNALRIELEDPPRAVTLRMNMQAYGHLQDAWGLENMGQIDKRLANVGVPEMIDMFHAAMLTDAPETTRAEANAIAAQIPPADFTEIMSELVASSRPPASEVAAAADPPKAKSKSH